MTDERRDRSDLRDKLADIDREILVQLDARARVSRSLGERAGAESSADVGEREWAESLVRASSGDMPAESVRAIFGQIRAASRALEQPVAVAYVAPEGGFCHEAALAHFGATARFVASLGIAEALEEVVRGRVGYAVFPFESSVDGLVQPSVTALSETDLMMVGERVLSASLDLMARTSDLGAVEHVYATALGQAACQRFLDTELPRASVIDVRSPIVAAELAREEPNAAALVPPRVGRAVSLETLRANVGDEPDLKLRYGFASARPAMRSGNDVTCLLFSVDDSPGSLFGVLRHFAERGVNLRKLQSRPVPHGSWDYVFYVELGAHVTERPVTTALEAIKRSAKYLKVLGSFPRRTGLTARLVPGMGTASASAGRRPAPMSTLVTPSIEALVPYEGGKPVEELARELGITHAIKLASNENPLGPSARALEAARQVLGNVHRYPDGAAYALRDRIAQFHGVGREEVLQGAGSNELLDLVVRAFATPEQHIVFAEPSFIVYRIAALSGGVPFTAVPLVDHAHDLPAMAAAVTPRTRVMFVANPNNPTGAHVGRAAVETLLRSVPPEVIVVMDEAYFEYADAADYPNSLALRHLRERLIVMRTFSKIYGLAGLRIGYAIGPARLVDYMNRVRAPFNVTSPGQAAAIAALDDHDHVQRSRETNRDERARLTRELEGLGLTVAPSQANFVLVDVGRPARVIYDRLLERGIIVRPFGNLPTSLRVTCGLPHEDDRFLGALKEVLA